MDNSEKQKKGIESTPDLSSNEELLKDLNEEEIKDLEMLSLKGGMPRSTPPSYGCPSKPKPPTQPEE